ncbi:MAG: M18 family aminopeptidase [Microthrixaceae bacterium]|nr:M18 family aminopeptidase [Microthrixaceae bacterium]
MRVDPAAAHSLGEFIDRSPTQFHAVATAVQMLRQSGFQEFDPSEPSASGRAYYQTGGVLIAWVDGASPDRPGRYIAAHTDSPNLRIRPRPDMVTAGISQLGVEVYGGALLNSWLDRDLGLAGRITVRESSTSTGSGSAVRDILWRCDAPLLRVPQLAIHLDREIGDRGLVLDRQRHMTPIWGIPDGKGVPFGAWIAEQIDVEPGDVLAWDLACFDFQNHSIIGADGEFLCAARLDNLTSCFAGLDALIEVAEDSERPTFLMLFDHEEVGSATSWGADSSLPSRVLELRASALGIERQSWLRALGSSVLLSADMAHATHPNYPERHEPSHHIALGGGPAIKYNSNERYATSSTTAGLFKSVCADAGIAVQEYSHRGDMACGSTIGPLLASQLGIPTVDVGAPQLSMHSAREMMAVADVQMLNASFAAWYR